jgi:hypothetical protein
MRLDTTHNSRRRNGHDRLGNYSDADREAGNEDGGIGDFAASASAAATLRPDETPTST